MAAIWHNAFLETLAATGNVTASALRPWIKTRAAAYLARKKSKRFREQWDEALEQAIDNLELEARTARPDRCPEAGLLQGRAGRDNPRVQRQCWLIFLLKAHRPETYRDNYTVRHEGEIEIDVTADEALLAKLQAMAAAVKSEGESG